MDLLRFRILGVVLLAATSMLSVAGVTVSKGGGVEYSLKIETPPGRGPEPKISVNYTGVRNGVLGTGWSLSAGMQISRCAAVKSIDGMPGTVDFLPTDKLCLNGVRLIALDAAGKPQTGLLGRDAEGLGANTFKEFRVETDSRTRVRAYGMAGSSSETGPLYFQVWHPDGGVSVFGKGPSDLDSRSNVYSTLPAYWNFGMTWLLADSRDRDGNKVNFFYTQAQYRVGTNVGDPSGDSSYGLDVAVREIHYGPGNKVVFSYSDRPDTLGAREETLFRGNKSVAVRLLDAISTYVNAPYAIGDLTGAVHVRTTRFSYDYGAVSGRPRLKDVRVCSTPAGNRCLPSTSFTYTEGGAVAYKEVEGLNLPSGLYAPSGLAISPSNAIAVDFDGDGKTDILKVTLDGAPRNMIFRNVGGGKFAPVIDDVIANERLVVEYWQQTKYEELRDCHVEFLVRDFNGDGRPDIFRFVNEVGGSGDVRCQSMASALYLNLPGGFVKKNVSGFPQRFKRWHPALTSRDDGSYPYAGWDFAENIFFLDLNGDGILDVLASRLNGKDYTQSTFDLCPSLQCTRAYIGDGNGGFVEIATNFAPYPMIQPGETGFGGSAAVDLNGDGLSDLIVMDPRSQIGAGSYGHEHRWADVAISRGDGNFDFKKNYDLISAVTSANVYDVQGDGQQEISLSSRGLNGTDKFQWFMPDPQFLTVPRWPWVGSNVPKWNGDLAANGGGEFAIWLDFNGDGRSDALFLVPWVDAKNIYEGYAGAQIGVAHGNGSMTQDRSFNIPLDKLGTIANGWIYYGAYKRQMLIGNFTGNSPVEILSLGYSGAGEITDHLFTPNNPIPPDRLLTVTEGVMGTSRITYQPAAASGRVAVESNVDADQMAVPPSGIIVTGLSRPSGVPGQPLVTEYAYADLRADRNGRGSLGYRVMKMESETPGGRKMTVVNTLAQRFPYAGMPLTVSTVLAGLSAEQGPILSLKEYAYCDAANDAAVRDSVVPGGEPCAAVSNPIKRPYTWLSRTSGRDLGGADMPTQTLATEVNASGYVVRTTTTNSFSGQTYRSIESTSYVADDVSCVSPSECRWWLARPERVNVARSVPNVLPSTNAAPNDAPIVIAPQPAKPINPAVLSAILQILLDD